MFYIISKTNRDRNSFHDNKRMPPGPLGALPYREDIVSFFTSLQAP